MQLVRAPVVRLQQIPQQLEDTYHIGNAEEFGGDCGGLDPQAHDVRNWSIQKPSLGGGEDGDKDMGPGEWEQERCQAVGSQHQLLAVWRSDSDRYTAHFKSLLFSLSLSYLMTSGGSGAPSAHQSKL